MTTPKYHHLGIPTTQVRPGETYLPQFKMYVSGYGQNPYAIEWMRFEPDCPLPEMVQKTPHIAFEVDDLALAIAGKKIVIESNSPSEGLTVAFIEDNGALVELMQWGGGGTEF